MALDQIHILRRPARLLIGWPHGSELPLGAGRQKLAFDVVGKTNACDDTVDRVAVLHRVIQPFEHQHSGALSHYQTVRLAIER